MRTTVLVLSATALLGGAVHATAAQWPVYITPLVIDTKTDQEAREAKNLVRKWTIVGRRRQGSWPFKSTSADGRRLGHAVARFALSSFVHSKARCFSSRSDRWNCAVSDNGAPEYKITVAVYRTGSAVKILR